MPNLHDQLTRILIHGRTMVFPLTIACCCASLSAPRDVQAQVLRLEKTDTNKPSSSIVKAPAGADEPGAVRILISPASEPSPALRYRFWVPEVRREGGNAITNMLRASSLVREIPNRQQLDVQWSEQWPPQLDAQPIDQFPKAQAREYLAKYQQVLSELAEMDKASRIDYEQHWNELKGIDVISVLFPEIQQSRHLARLIQTQARLAIAEGRFEDAIESIRIGFRLSEVVSHMGRSFLIGKLVSIVICRDMLGEVEVLIQQPGAPNLYWALASWPNELDNLQSATEGEMVAIERMFYRLTELPDEPITDAAWQARISTTTDDLLRMADSTTLNDPEAQKRATALWAGLSLLLYGDRSKELLLAGQEIKNPNISYSEALVRHTREELMQLLNDYFKWSLLSLDASAYRDRSDALISRARVQSLTPASLIASQTLPSLYSVHDQHRRMVNFRNRLITIEALRAYAAEHNTTLPEKLPSQLDEVTTLPAWNTSIDGQAFQYQRTSPTQATLKYASPWPLDPRSQTELSLRK